jgi:primosomal replication protein N
MNVNQLCLQAKTAERAALRYTPANIAVLDMVLEHLSDQSELSAADAKTKPTTQSRAVKLLLKAKAFGLNAEKLQFVSLDQEIAFTGFLGNGKGGKSVVFHVQSFEVMSPVAQASQPS